MLATWKLKSIHRAVDAINKCLSLWHFLALWSSSRLHGQIEFAEEEHVINQAICHIQSFPPFQHSVCRSTVVAKVLSNILIFLLQKFEKATHILSAKISIYLPCFKIEILTSC